MKQQLQELFHMLQGLIQLHEQLLVICERKKEALVNVRMEALDGIILEEEKVASRLHQVERARIELVAEIHRLYYADRKVIQMETILQCAPEPEKTKLADSRVRLVQLVKKLATINELNKILCTQSLESVTYCLDLLTSTAVKNHKSYNMHARETEPKRIQLLDRTA